MNDSAWADELIEQLQRDYPALLRLTQLASLAVQIDAPLVRQLRRRFARDTDPGIEADLWFSPLVAAHDEASCMLHEIVTLRLRERLAASDLLDAAAEVLRTAHAHMPAVLRLEEDLTTLALRAKQDADITSEIDQALSPALRALASADEDSALETARWAMHAVRRLPERVRAARSMQALLLGAALRLELPALAGKLHETALEASELTWLLPSETLAQRTKLGIALFANGLRFEEPEAAHNTIELPKTSPALLSIRWLDRHKLASVAPGVFVELEDRPRSVEIVTLAGDTYVLSRLDVEDVGERHEAPNAESSVAEARRADTSHDAAAACVRLGESDGSPTAFFVEPGYWVSDSHPFTGNFYDDHATGRAGYSGALGSARQARVKRRREALEQRYELLDFGKRSTGRGLLLMRARDETLSQRQLALSSLHLQIAIERAEHRLPVTVMAFDEDKFSPIAGHAAWNHERQRVEVHLDGDPSLHGPLGAWIAKFAGAPVLVGEEVLGVIVDAGRSTERFLSALGATEISQAIVAATLRDRAPEPEADVGGWKGVTCVRFVAGDQHLVAGLSDGTICTYDAKTGLVRDKLERHPGAVSALVTDGRELVASGSLDGTLRLTRGQHQRLMLNGGVRSLVLADGGTELIAGSANRGVGTLSIESGRFTQLTAPVAGTVRALMTPRVGLAGAARAFVTNGEVITVWELPPHEGLYDLSGHTAPVLAIAVAPNGRFAVSGSSDGIMRVWDLENLEEGRARLTLEGHSAAVRAVEVTADCRRILSGGMDGKILIWDVETGSALAQLEQHSAGVLTLAVSASGDEFASGGQDGEIRVWDARTMRLTRVIHTRT